MQNQNSDRIIKREWEKPLKQHSTVQPPHTDLQKQKLQLYMRLSTQLLEELIEQQSSQNECIQPSPFDSELLKKVKLEAYLESVHSKTNFEPECLIIALMYIDRYNLASPDFTLGWHNIHKLLLTCLLLATKFHDDVYYDNRAFENGGAINNAQLIQLETQVFERLDFELFVSEEEFFEFLGSLLEVYEPQEADE